MMVKNRNTRELAKISHQASDLDKTTVDPALLAEAKQSGKLLPVVETKAMEEKSKNSKLLITSTKSNKAKKVKELLKKPCTIQSVNEALCLAASYGYTKIVKFLLADKRKDLKESGLLCVYLAAKCEQDSVLKLLLSDPTAKPEWNNNASMAIAAKSGNYKVVELLLADPRPSPTDECLRNAVKNGHERIVDLFLKDGRVSPDALESESLRLACKNGYVGIVKLLLEDGRVDPCVKDNEPLRVAINNQYVDIVACLLANDQIDPTFSNNEPLRFACERGNANIVKEILKYPDVNPTDCESEALIDASWLGHKDVVEVLLEDERTLANPTEVQEAMFWSFIRGHAPIIKLFLQKDSIRSMVLDTVLLDAMDQLPVTASDRLFKQERIHRRWRSHYEDSDDSDDDKLELTKVAQSINLHSSKLSRQAATNIQ